MRPETRRMGWVVCAVPVCSHPLTKPQVLAVSTDYRDFRKSAFQEFAIVCCYNAIRIPHSVNPFRVASIGVAYVAAGLALGACLGTSFPRPRNKRPFNLLDVSQRYLEDVPDDIAPQIIQGLQPGSRASPGEWLLVYGGMRGTLSMQPSADFVKRQVSLHSLLFNWPSLQGLK